MYFRIVPLSSELIFIKWYRLPEPGISPEKDILEAMHNLLENAPDKIYFLSDLRGGRIMDVRLLQQLSKLRQHPNWGEGTAFAKDSMSKMFAKVYSQFSNTIEVRREIWDTPEEAIAFLESIKPGISVGIEWATVLEVSSS